MQVLGPASPQTLNRKNVPAPPPKKIILPEAADVSAEAQDDTSFVDEAVLREELTREAQLTPEKAAAKVAEWESARRDEDADDEAEAEAGMEEWWADRKRAKEVAEELLRLHTPRTREREAAAEPTVAGSATIVAAPPVDELTAEEQQFVPAAPSAPWVPGAGEATRACSLAWVIVPLLGVAAAALIASTRRA